MGLRLYSEFSSHNGTDYKIEIYDTLFSGTAETFTVANDGFTLNYSGQTDDIVSPIISSNCTINAFNNSDAFDSFTNDLIQYQEERFRVKISKKADSATVLAVNDYFQRVQADGGTFEARACLEFAIDALGGISDSAQAYYILNLYKYRVENDGGTYEGSDQCAIDKLNALGFDDYFTFWTGTIMQDLVTVEDTHKPYILQITAVDGIGQLANKDYTETTGNTTILEFLQSAVNAIGTTDLYNDTDTVLATTLNIWDTNQVYSETTDATSLSRFARIIYRNVQEDNTIQYSNYLEILKDLCIAFGCRFYQREGAFIFEQYLERTNTSRRIFNYSANGDLLIITNIDDDLRLDQTTSGARLAGNEFNFLPALKKVQISFNQERINNLLANDLTFTSSTPRQQLGFVPKDDNGRLQINGDLIYELVPSGAGGAIGLTFWRPVWQIEVRVEDVLNPGTYYYLKREWLGGSGAQLYGPTSWTTTPSYYNIDGSIGLNNSGGLYLYTPVAIVTPPLPVSGDAEIDVDFLGVYDADNVIQSVPAYFTEIVQSKRFKVTYLNDSGSTPDVSIFSATNTDAKVNSSLVLDLGTIKISDSAGLQGSLYVYNGSNWVRSTGWRRGNSGSYISLLKLLTNEVLALHKVPIERYQGTIVGTHPFGIRYVFEDAFWLPMQGTYNANLDEWTSEWFKVQKDLNNISIDQPIDIGGGGEFAGRISSQQGTDEIINVVELNATTGKVTGNAEIGGTLGVTGAATLSDNLTVSGDTNVGNFEHTGNHIVNITEVTNENGSTYDVTASDYMIFNTWTGGNGTAEINLPSAASNEGRLLRFKSDGTISSSTSIDLNPVSGETIDGETTFAFNRDYDGVMLLAHNEDWYIIQRKSK